MVWIGIEAALVVSAVGIVVFARQGTGVQPSSRVKTFVGFGIYFAGGVAIFVLGRVQDTGLIPIVLWGALGMIVTARLRPRSSGLRQRRRRGC